MKPPHTTTKGRIFKLTGEPLCGGKGKCSSLTSNDCDSELGAVCNDAEDISQLDKKDDNLVLIGHKFEGLQQPQLLVTNSVVRGKDKTIMRHENKQ